MSHMDRLRGKFLHLMLLIGLVTVSMIPVGSWALAEDGSASIWVVRSLSTSEYGVSDPKGLAFSPEANTFFLMDGDSNVTLVTMAEEQVGSRRLSEVQADPLNAAFDERSGSLVVFKRSRSELVKIKADGKGLLDASASPARFAVNALGIADPQGITFDPDTGRLFILDAGNWQIVSVTSHATLGFDIAKDIRRISLTRLGRGLLRGLAYNPGNGHLYVSEPGERKLYELTQRGELVSSFDLAALGIDNPSAMTFAPSVDNTDDPSIYGLFVLDLGGSGQTAKPGLVAPVQQTTASEGQLVELSLQAPAALPAGTTLLSASLVNIIDTSNAAWNPSSPDPAGVDYWPLTGRLLVVDSEVNEMPPYWQGKNVFDATISGSSRSPCADEGLRKQVVAAMPEAESLWLATVSRL